MKTTFWLATAIVILAGLSPLAHAVDPTAWNTKINGTSRFKVLNQFNGEAVFDKETGLVWERAAGRGECDWFEAQSHCVNLVLGNRKGWRLPTIQELASLVDPAQSDPALPAGHPFSVLSFLYWSATSYANDTSQAWVVDFSNGDAFGYGKVRYRYSFAWCVRGGQGVDPE